MSWPGEMILLPTNDPFTVSFFGVQKNWFGGGFWWSEAKISPGAVFPHRLVGGCFFRGV